MIWALEHLPNQFVLAQVLVFKRQFVCICLTDNIRYTCNFDELTGYLFPETYQFIDELTSSLT